MAPGHAKHLAYGYLSGLYFDKYRLNMAKADGYGKAIKAWLVKSASYSETKKKFALRTQIANMTTRTQTLVFAFLCAVSIFFWWRPLGETVGRALANDAYIHILLILPLSAALIYADWKYMKARAHRIDSQPRPFSGAVLLAVALVLGCYARWGMGAAPGDLRLSLAMFALVSWWIASVLLCFGVRTFQLFLFPVCFLFLMVPIPDFALSWIVEFLALSDHALCTTANVRIDHSPAVTTRAVMIVRRGLRHKFRQHSETTMAGSITLPASRVPARAA